MSAEEPPKSAKDVNDVLSSIRKLVSDEVYASDLAEGVATEQAPEAQTPLVLAPFLRVPPVSDAPGKVEETAVVLLDRLGIPDAGRRPYLVSSKDTATEEMPVDATEETEIGLLDGETPSKNTRAGAEQSVPDSPYFDEQALRGLVAEMVREELRGALGEQIARNIRSMVRRELDRANTPDKEG